MPSLRPLSERAETLTPLPEGSLTATPLPEAAETVSPLAALVPVPSVFTPGLLPSITLFPGTDMLVCSTTTICSASLIVGCDGPYPNDNESSPAIEGVVLAPLAETASLALTPLPED